MDDKLVAAIMARKTSGEPDHANELAQLRWQLEQKEQDLELAAKIGDALFQENTKLRKGN